MGVRSDRPTEPGIPWRQLGKGSLLLWGALTLSSCGSPETVPPQPSPEPFVGRWSEPQVVGDAGPGFVGSRLSGGGGSVTGLLLDDTGRGVVLFSNIGDPADPLLVPIRTFANTYAAASGWSTPVRLSPSFQAFPDALAGDGHGNAIVVWDTNPGGELDANRFAAQGGWQPATLIAKLPQSTNAAHAQVVEGPDGAALAAWTDTALRVARMSPAGVWGASTAIGPPAFFFDLAGTPSDPLMGFVNDNRLLFLAPDGKGGWQPAAEVPGTGSIRVDAPGGLAATADNVGGFMLAWFRSDVVGNTAGIAAARYAAATGWSAPVSIEAGTPDPGERALKLVAGPAGHILAYWLHGDGHLWANLYTPRSGWGSAGPVSSAMPLAQSGLPPGTSAAAGAAAAIDGSGNALVLWAEAGVRLVSARATPGGPWSVAQALPSAPGTRGIVGPLALAMNTSGSAIAAWAQPSMCDSCPAPREVWAASYEPH